MARSLPRLMELQERFAGRTDEFAILAVHDRSAPDFETLEAKLRELERSVWKGRSLPFPILLDARGESLATYGIQGLPTSVLIDPRGRIVQGDAADLLEDHLLATSLEVRALVELLGRDLERGLAQAQTLETEHAGRALVEHAERAPADQRARLATALRKVGGRCARDYFLGPAGLGSADVEARRGAVEALREVAAVHDGRAIQALIEVVNRDPDQDLRRSASAAAMALTGR